jgi:uncharacterized protein Ymh
MTWGNCGALGGTRTPILLIRSYSTCARLLGSGRSERPQTYAVVLAGPCLSPYLAAVYFTPMRLAERFVLRAAKRRNPSYFVRLQALIILRDQANRHARNVTTLFGVRKAWTLQATTVLTEVLGEFHPLVAELEPIWKYKEPEDILTKNAWAKQSWQEGRGILDSAITSYIFMNTNIHDSSVVNMLDADLMARVDHVFRVEDWTAVASLAATFVEDRFRAWAGLDHTAFGVNLMTRVLHPETGVFPLGVAPGEVEGWHQFGRGFMSACSNVDRHRIQSRDDLQRYAMGVLGSASLLLTQMRYQHGNRFKNP